MPVNEMIRKNLRSLLWEHPLFETLSKERPTLHIVVIGFDEAAENFLRYSAEMAVCHENPVYTILCTDTQKLAFDAMLTECPALSDFFEIDGKTATYEEQIYGRIRVLTVSRIDEKSLTKLLKNEPPADYIFITARNDAFAIARAKLCAIQDPDAVTAVSLKQKPETIPTECLHFVPFYAEQILDEHDPLQAMLERIAKNIHFIWGDGRHFKQVEAEFYDPHNYMSSLDNAASLQYKLYFSLDSMELHKMNVFEAAEEFRRRTAGPDGAEIIDRIAWLEHRRWIVEHLLNNYQRWDDFDSSASKGKTHIETETEKRHLCLRPSLQAAKVHGMGKKLLSDYKLESWQTLNPMNLPDPIDQVSLRMYSAYKKILENARGYQAVHQKEYETIVRCVHNSPSAMNLFESWQSCVQSILNEGDAYALQLYPQTFEKLEQAIKEHQDEAGPLVSRQALNTVNMLNDIIQIGQKAFRYTDYRKIDVDMTKYIPHLLTYDDTLMVVVPASPKLCSDLTDTDRLFQNFAAVYALNPATACFFICLRSQSEWEDTAPCLKRIKRFFLDLGPRSRTDWQIHVFILEKCGVIRKQIMKPLTEKQEGQKPLFIEDEIHTHFSRDPAQNAVNLLHEWNHKKILYAVQYRDDCALSGFISVQNDIPQFVMNIQTVPVQFAAFTRDNKPVPETARIFEYYRSNAVVPLLLDDVAKLAGTVLRVSPQPVYIPTFTKTFDYFQTNMALWKDCVYALGEADSEYHRFGFSLKRTDELDTEINFVIPESANYNRSEFSAAMVALEKRYGLIKGFDSRLTENGNPKYSFQCRKCDESKFRRILQLLSQCQSQKGEYKVYALENSLTFKLNLLSCTFSIDEGSEFMKTLLKKRPDAYQAVKNGALFQFIENMRKLSHIKSFVRSETSVTIIYASDASKDILISEGRLFELYLYFQMKKHAYTELKSSVEVLWAESDRSEEELKNEFDLIAMSGYRIFEIEAKVSNDLKPDAVYKFAALTGRFGVAPVKLLINFSKRDYRKLIETAKVFHITMLSGNDPKKLLEQITELNQ